MDRGVTVAEVTTYSNSVAEHVLMMILTGWSSRARIYA
jgi:lactate dehydrogenase-like 2-hydroxyacid dehydrogenase